MSRYHLVLVTQTSLNIGHPNIIEYRSSRCHLVSVIQISLSVGHPDITHYRSVIHSAQRLPQYANTSVQITKSTQNTCP